MLLLLLLLLLLQASERHTEASVGLETRLETKAWRRARTFLVARIRVFVLCVSATLTIPGLCLERAADGHASTATERGPSASW